MTFEPHNNFIIAKVVVPAKETTTTDTGFEYVKENLPQYEILMKSSDVEDFDIGDIIISQSTGTQLDDGIFMFDADNVAGKLC